MANKGSPEKPMCNVQWCMCVNVQLTSCFNLLKSSLQHNTQLSSPSAPGYPSNLCWNLYRNSRLSMTFYTTLHANNTMWSRLHSHLINTLQWLQIINLLRRRSFHSSSVQRPDNTTTNLRWLLSWFVVKKAIPNCAANIAVIAIVCPNISYQNLRHRDTQMASQSVQPFLQGSPVCPTHRHTFVAVRHSQFFVMLGKIDSIR